MTEQGDPRAAFVEAACVPLDRGSGHATGTLERAEAILAAHPEVATGDVHTAAILGDDATGQTPPRRAARVSGTR